MISTTQAEAGCSAPVNRSIVVPIPYVMSTAVRNGMAGDSEGDKQHCAGNAVLGEGQAAARVMWTLEQQWGHN